MSAELTAVRRHFQRLGLGGPTVAQTEQVIAALGEAGLLRDSASFGPAACPVCGSIGARALMLDHIEAEHPQLAEALKFYADPASYDVSGPLEGGAWGSAPRRILDDGGALAREALS